MLRELPWVRPNVLRDSLLAAPDALRATRVVRRTLARVRPDVIYVWNGAGMPSATIAALLASGIPTAFRVCEYWFGDLFSADVSRAISRRASAACAASGRGSCAGPIGCPGSGSSSTATCRPRVLEQRVRARRCAGSRADPRVHEAIVIPSNARTAERPGCRGSQAGRILFVGRLEEQKGAAVVVRALAELVRAGDETATLALVGPGDEAEREVLVRLAADSGVADRVRLTGPLRGQELEDEITAAAAWVVPSVCGRAGAADLHRGRAGPGARGCSRCVGGIPEMFRDGEEALFFERGDHVGCAAALADALRGDAQGQARVARAYERGQELSFGPYLAAMDRFLAEGVEALAARRAPRAPAAPRS